MMKQVIAIIGVCFFTTFCLAQEKYSNSQWRFSFTLPEGWEVITDDTLIGERAKEFKVRFEGAEILALCQEVSSDDEKNSILVGAQSLGEVKEGVVFEALLEERLDSQGNWDESNAYLMNFRRKLIEKGEIAQKAEYKRIIHYNSDKHIFRETMVLLRKRGDVIGISVVRLLGSNRATTLNFNLYGWEPNALLGLIEETASSFAYDKNYGFGEAPGVNVMKILWHWLFPGFGTVIVIFFLYKWASSEYG